MTAKVTRTPNADIAQRFFDAQTKRERELGRRITLVEIGAEVAALLGREEAFDAGVVRKWLRGVNEPDFATMRAIARVLNADPGVLAFGDEDQPLPADRAPRGKFKSAAQLDAERAAKPRPTRKERGA